MTQPGRRAQSGECVLGICRERMPVDDVTSVNQLIGRECGIEDVRRVASWQCLIAGTLSVCPDQASQDRESTCRARIIQ